MTVSSGNGTATSTWSSEVNAQMRFRSATDCMDYLGPSAYQPITASQGMILAETTYVGQY